MQLLQIARIYNVEFVSIREGLCTERGCLLSIGNSISNVTSLDQGHLSDLAAEYFIEVSEKKIFGNEY